MTATTTPTTPGGPGAPFRTAARSRPRLGGFTLTLLVLEVRRLLRNRRTFVFTLIMPVALF